MTPARHAHHSTLPSVTPKAPQTPPHFSRRERQIMDVVYRLGVATAAEIQSALPDAPTYTTVRGLLRVLVEKGHLDQRADGRRYVYRPLTPKPTAGASSIAHVVKTFFGGSPTDAIAALLGSSHESITDDELKRLSALVARVRREKSQGQP
jgi:BlaI family transcriptional regulator, penicillinase repressor